MKILVLNSGSSSVKFQIIETDLERMNAHQDLTLAVGQVEKIGLSDSRLVLEVPDRKTYQDYREILEHRTAIEWVLRILTDPEHGIIERLVETLELDLDDIKQRLDEGKKAFEAEKKAAASSEKRPSEAGAACPSDPVVSSEPCSSSAVRLRCQPAAATSRLSTAAA